MRLDRWPFALLVVALVLCAAQPALSSGSREHQVRAALLYSFSKFVSWPDDGSDSRSPVVFCVLGESPFLEVLREKMKGRSVGGRPADVQRIASPQAADECQVLFLARMSVGELRSVLARLPTAPVLTVAAADGFLEQGGMINLTQREGKSRFEINLHAARRAGFKINARVLKLADRVLDEPVSAPQP